MSNDPKVMTLTEWAKQFAIATTKQQDKIINHILYGREIYINDLTLSIDNTKRRCPNCKSENIAHQVWGRVEYDVCRDCLTEVKG